MEFIIKTTSKEATRNLGQKLASTLRRGDVWTLTGDLGAGKTTFVQGVARGLECSHRVISPTFNILRCYFEAKIPFFHIDAYRLKEGNKDIGLEEFIEGEGVTFIEWPEYIEELLTVPICEVNITIIADDERQFVFRSNSERYRPLFQELKEINDDVNPLT
ncbi:MAG: tRNA (adenosine(37)-N6)-threonylcarbamoyltransferase complex ATPase subunit type 1 TsaE [Bacilli bacterium]|jgi:tRNA threonylcarbamoyladenosine biosynthesis protein TsaE